MILSVSVSSSTQSDHTLVIAELKGEIIRKHRKLTTIMKRPNWRKCDKDLYKETLVQSLSKIEFDNSSTTTHLEAPCHKCKLYNLYAFLYLGA
jgi:hypothetical protein